MSPPSRRLLWSAALIAAVALVYHPIWTGGVLAGRDVFRLFIPDASFLKDCLRAGDWPLWNPYARLGQPFAATLQSQAFYPPRLLAVLVAEPVWALTLEHLLHVVIAAVGTFRLARGVGASRAAAALGASAFALGPFYAQLGIQANVVSAAAWSGWILLGARAVAREASFTSAARLALPVGLSFLAGSPETLLWQALLAAFVAVPASRARGAAFLAVGLLWGAALAAVVALPGAEFAYQGRHAGGGDPLTWSTPGIDLVSMGWFLANLPRGDYWSSGDQHFVVVLFLGALASALALVGACSGRRARPYAAGALALGLLSLGRHFAPAALVLHLPPFSLFRYPAKYAVGAAFCVALLSALGLDALTHRARRLRPSLRRAGAALLLASALFALGARLAPRLGLRAGAVPGLAWSLSFLAGGATLLLGLRGPRRLRRLRSALAALGLVELGAAHAVLGQPLWLDARTLAAPSPLAEALPRPYHGRVSVNLEGDPEETGPGVYRFMARSRPALYPLRFMEERVRAVEGYGAPRPARFDDFLRDAPPSTYDLVGAAYLVRRERPAQNMEPLLAPEGLPALYRSPTALPRAFLVHRAVKATDAEALAATRDPAEPFRRTAFLAEGEPLPDAGCESPAVTFLQDAPRELHLALDACAEGYLLLSDADYPGWRAEVDGVQAPIHRADFLLRAVRVPAGRHEVTFRYRPVSFTLGGALSLSALAALAWTLRPRKTTARRPS